MSHSSRFLKISLTVLVITQLISIILIIDKISGNTILKAVIDILNIPPVDPLPDLLGYIELSFVTAIGAAGAWVAISIASNTEKLQQFANTLQQEAIKNESPDYLAAKCITANIQKLEAITSQFFGYGEFCAEEPTEEGKDHYYIRQLNIIDECISHVDTHTMLYRFSRQLKVADEYKSLQSSILKLIVKVQYTKDEKKRTTEQYVLGSRIYQYIQLIKWCTKSKISPNPNTVESYYFSLSPLQYLNGSDLLNQHNAVLQTLFPMHQFLPANALETFNYPNKETPYFSFYHIITDYDSNLVTHGILKQRSEMHLGYTRVGVKNHITELITNRVPNQFLTIEIPMNRNGFSGEELGYRNFFELIKDELQKLKSPIKLRVIFHNPSDDAMIHFNNIHTVFKTKETVEFGESHGDPDSFFELMRDFSKENYQNLINSNIEFICTQSYLHSSFTQSLEGMWRHEGIRWQGILHTPLMNLKL